MSISSSVTSSSQRIQNVIRLMLGLTVVLAGCANMISVLIPRPNLDLVLGAWMGNTLYGSHKLMIVVGFFLLMLSFGIVRGKRQAWLTTILLLLLSIVLQGVTRSPVFITLATTLLTTTVVLFARCFQAKSDPPSIRRGYVALTTGLGVVTLYAIGGFVLLYQQFEPLFDRFGMEPTIVRILIHSHILQFVSTTQAMIFGRALPILCMCAILYGIAQILHPVAAVLLPNEEELNHATHLTRTYGKNSISYFALSREKSFFFSASGKSCISYVLEGSTAVVAGDPIGPEEELFSTMQQFIRFCHDQDWTVVFWQIRENLLDLYRAAGLHQMKIGEDAIIDTRTFTLAGKAMANVRSSAKRAEKEGMHIVFSQGPIQNTSHLAQMERISHTWLANKGGSEKGFSMGRFEKHGDTEQVYALAIDATDTVQAFVTFVPIYGRNGWGLDLMRRVEQTTPGTMELLLSRSILYLKERGTDVVSLGLAPLSHSNPSSEENLLESSIDFLTHRFGDPNKQQSLFTFKKKFQPIWESRYLVYSNTLQLPAVGWALYHAHQHDVTLLTFLYHTLKEWRQRAQTTREHVTAVARAVTGSLTVEPVDR